MQLPMAAVTMRFNSAEVSDTRTAVNLGIRVQNFEPGSRLWKTQLEVVIRVAREVYDNRNRVARFVVAQEGEQVLVGIAAIDPLETAVVVVKLPHRRVLDINLVQFRN
jgi:predicted GH43/DUF377 family glycosyl hydrolase